MTNMGSFKEPPRGHDEDVFVYEYRGLTAIKPVSPEGHRYVESMVVLGAGCLFMGVLYCNEFQAEQCFYEADQLDILTKTDIFHRVET